MFVITNRFKKKEEVLYSTVVFMFGTRLITFFLLGVLKVCTSRVVLFKFDQDLTSNFELSLIMQ